MIIPWEKLKYIGRHQRRQRLLGKATHCSLNPNHLGKYEWANLDHKYSPDEMDYAQLCHSCHVRYDMGELIINGKSIIDRGGVPIYRGGSHRHTEASKGKMSKSHKGKHFTEETKEKMSKSAKIGWIKRRLK